MGVGYIVNFPHDLSGKGMFPLRINSSENRLLGMPAGIGKPVVLTDAANIATDASLGDVFTVTLGASRIMDAPTNPTDMQKIIYLITQGGTGSNTITWNAAFAFGSDLPVPTLSPAVGKIDALGFMYVLSINKWLYIAESRGY